MTIPSAKIWHHREKFSHVQSNNPIWNFYMQMYKYGEATGKIARKYPGILLVRWYGLMPVVMIVGSLLTFLSWLSGVLDHVFVPLFYFGLFFYILVLILTTVEVFVLTRRTDALIGPFLLIGHHVFYAVGFLRAILKK